VARRRTLLTTGEVAELLAVSPRTVDRWAEQHLLPVRARTLGGHRRYDPETVERLRRELTAAPPPPALTAALSLPA